MAKSKLLVIALTVSLAVNVAVAGFVAAQWFRHGGPPRMQTGLMFDRHAAFSVLDDVGKQQIGEIWLENRPLVRSGFKNYRQAKRHLSNLLSAQDLDREAIGKAHLEMMNGRNEIEKTLTATLLKSAELLPPETRVEFFKTGFQRWKSRHHRKDGSPE